MKTGEAYLNSLQKRQMDILGASMVAAALGLPAACSAAAIKLVDGQPPIFQNVRIGQDMQPYNLLKLTTMVPDAHLRERQWQHDATDTRITRLGKVLRRLDLNEVPQVINVLRGEMHFIGARPVNEHVLARLEEADKALFDEWQPLYAQHKPGIVGPGQLAERKYVREGDLRTASQERMRLDMQYWLADASLATDVSLVLQTPLEVIAGHLGRQQQASIAP